MIGKLQALVMQAAEGHRGAVITIVSENNPLCSLNSQAADNYGTQTTLQSTLPYVVYPKAEGTFTRREAKGLAVSFPNTDHSG